MWESQEIIDKLMSHASLLVSAIGNIHFFQVCHYCFSDLFII